MAVGVSERRMGEAERQTAVRGDFALVPSGAYNVSPGDVFDAAVSVANMMEKFAGDSGGSASDDGTGTGSCRQRRSGSGSWLTAKKGKRVLRLKSGERLGSVPLVFSAANRDNSDQSSRISYEAGIRPASSFVSRIRWGLPLTA